MLAVEDHPLLELAAFTTTFPAPLGDGASPPWLTALLAAEPVGHPVPFERSEEIRSAVRDLLRHGGYKPTGRGKPASEYLLRAATEGTLAPINPAVDACNAASLHSGLPVSVVDRDRLREPLVVRLAVDGTRYAFNRADQEIDVAGLPCLHDAGGACACAVKDAQRTKTGPETARTVSLVWGTRVLPGRAEAVAGWYRALLERLGARTEAAEIGGAPRPS